MSSLTAKNWLGKVRDISSIATSPAAIIFLCGVMAYMAYKKTRRNHVTYDEADYKNEGHVKLPVPLKGLQLTRKQLAEYNSNRADKTYLLALNDVIYDVSSGTSDFGPTKKYASLPGSDIKNYIKKQSRLERRDYKVCLNEWQMKLEDLFHPAGKLIDDADSSMDSIPEKIEEEKDDVELGTAKPISTYYISSDEDCDSDSEDSEFEDSPSKDDRDDATLMPAP